ncbi:MAG: alpha-L-arabinofuranosidase C-terminal domain-containing protein [Alistipes sp.]
MTTPKRLICVLIAAVLIFDAVAADSRVEIDLGRRGAEIPASLYGVFFEEITGSGDGGLYAEMIRNRGFEEGVLPSGCTLDAEGYAAAPHRPCYSNDSINRFRVRWSSDLGMTGWRTQYADGSQAASTLTDEYPLRAATPHALRLELCAARGEVSAVNSGYWGIAVEQGKHYELEFYVRAEGTPWCRAAVVNAAGTRLAQHDQRLTADGQWHRYTVSFAPSATDSHSTLQITFPAEGRVWLDYVSLFPRDTYKGRPNGLRKDVATLIEELHPAFIRWPGGCIVEGLTLENRVQWKQTIGDPIDRPGEYNLWGYRSTYGFGYHEFLQYCEDIGSQGMFVCNAGMSCLFRNGDYVQGEALEPLIQEALDAIEYALGDAKTTRWGAERAKNGHIAPFPLKYVEIGNENIFARYADNYNRFHKAIKAKYPQLTLISALMFSDDVKRLDRVEVIDPHYYETADWFYNNADVYDKLPASLPYKIYVGEYAATGHANLYSSLSEAAYMTGVERNADKVQLVSYAPLIENAHYGRNHLVVLDNRQAYGRTNYHVMKLFAENRPDVNTPTRITGEITATPCAAKGFIGLGTVNTAAMFRDLKIVNRGRTLYATDWNDLEQRWTPLRGAWSAQNNILTQSNVGGEALLYLKDLELGDCTITLKARKTAGREGFRVIFGLQDEQHYYMVDMGGYSNESVLFRQVSDKGWVSLFDYRNQEPIEANQWYDVRLEIRGNEWKCYLNGVLKESHRHTLTTKHYAVSGIDRARRELVVKLVNGESEPWQTTLSLKGGSVSPSEARRIVLSSSSANDENSFDEPEKIIARESAFTVNGRTIPVVCAPTSLTVLRIPIQQ